MWRTLSRIFIMSNYVAGGDNWDIGVTSVIIYHQWKDDGSSLRPSSTILRQSKIQLVAVVQHSRRPGFQLQHVWNVFIDKFSALFDTWPLISFPILSDKHTP